MNEWNHPITSQLGFSRDTSLSFLFFLCLCLCLCLALPSSVARPLRPQYLKKTIDVSVFHRAWSPYPVPAHRNSIPGTHTQHTKAQTSLAPLTRVVPPVTRSNPFLSCPKLWSLACQTIPF
ncbi:hypothetical protein QBC40DRAFT_276069 [Triangularia verruculosa]|uniref:Uncharacterized protein n=1 Tax=Triangularia verruculosa TaxID=2587418 RepID=A0AAN7AVI9_9PEZI|nr:hypothetical protein QBC40DRAFT_276069 [Triangularia verruculosa]